MNRPKSDDPLDIQEWIDEVADRFESAWKESPSPSIANYVSGTVGDSRRELLLELLRIDMQHRERNNEPVVLDSYIGEFPELLDEEGKFPDDLIVFSHQLESKRRIGDSDSDTGIGDLTDGIKDFSDIQLPKSLGRFQLLEFLGSGNFGAVFKARDSELQRMVAIKIPKPGVFSGRQDGFRFMQEARTAGQLRHPNIVQLHEVGKTGETPYLVTDFVQGQTLEDVMSENPPELKETVKMIQTIALALHHAHLNQVIHRDIKPSNVLVDQQGRPLVADFGLATQLDSHVKRTIAGQVLGTPAYMSPEQAQGERDVDARTDIYSLGVVLYEMISGERPFGGNIRMIMNQVINEEPRSPRRLNDKVPRDLEVICLKAISKSKSQRYESALHFAEDLGRFLKGEPISARPITKIEIAWRWSLRNPALAISLSVIAILLVGTSIGATLASLNYSELAEKEKETRLDEQESSRLARQELSRSMAANGILRLRNDDVGGLHDLLDSVEVESLSPEERASRLRLSNSWADEIAGRLVNVVGHESQLRFARFCNDGQWILTGTQDCKFRIWDSETGSPISKEFVHGNGAVFLAEVLVDTQRKHIISIDQVALIRFWSMESGEMVHEIQGDRSSRGLCNNEAGSLLGYTVEKGGQRLFRIQRTEDLEVLDEFRVNGQVQHAQFSPREGMVAVCVGKAGMVVYDYLNSNIVWQFDAHDELITDIAFSGSGSMLATSSLDDTVKVWSLKEKKVLGEPMKHDEDVRAVAFSPTDNLVASAGFDSTVRMWDPHRSKPDYKELVHQGPVLSIDFDRSGNYLVTGGFDTHVRVWSTDTGSQVRRLMQHQGLITSVEFDSVSNRILSASNDKTARIWEMNVKSKNLTELLHTDRVWSLDFSPDSKLLSVISQDQKARIWDVESGEEHCPFLEHPGTAIATRFSPDAKFLATIDQQRIRFWDVKSNFETYEQIPFEFTYRTFEFGPDSERFAAGTDAPLAVFFDRRSREDKHRLLEHPATVSGVAFDPQGKFIVTGCDDGRIRIWDGETGDGLKEFVAHQGPIESICLSSDGSLLATASRDLTVRFWSTHNWDSTGFIIRPQTFVQGMAFDPSTKLLATSGSNGDVQIWDVKTALPCGLPIKQKIFATTVRFSPDGKYLATGGFDKKVRLWKLPDWFHDVDADATRDRSWRILASSRDEQGTENVLPWQEWQQLGKRKKSSK